jgi:hypothetical protein
MTIYKIKNAEVGYVQDNDPLHSNKFKGIILEIESINLNKTKNKIWLDMHSASEIKLIPFNFGNHTDDEVNKYLKKNKIGKIINLSLGSKFKLKNIFKKKK